MPPPVTSGFRGHLRVDYHRVAQLLQVFLQLRYPDLDSMVGKFKIKVLGVPESPGKARSRLPTSNSRSLVEFSPQCTAGGTVTGWLGSKSDRPVSPINLPDLISCRVSQAFCIFNTTLGEM